MEPEDRSGYLSTRDLFSNRDFQIFIPPFERLAGGFRIQQAVRIE
jgi:hypothetical protein